MKLNYKKLGEGKPLIILHGLFGSLDNWLTLAKEFAEFREVYLVDQRNHGNSPHSNEFNYQVMAEDLNEFIKEHGIENPAILGHSMGGKTAMNYAINHTADWDKLIVVDIAPKAYPVHHDHIIEALQSLHPEKLESRSQAEEEIGEYLEDPGQRLFLLKNLKRNSEGGFSWKMNLPVIEANMENIGQGLEERLATEKDVLFIRGENSHYIKDKDYILIAQIFPNAQIETVKGAGHWVHAEKPNELFDLVRHFLIS
jgi:pimeloyl-ACP methyl ester carboxylesterase